MVGQVVRRMMGLQRNIRDSIETHAYSVPFLGQVNFGGAYADFNVDKKAKFELVDESTEGAKAIPAAIIGYTAHKIRQDGLKIPTFGNRDFLALCVGKVMSRPLTAFIFSSLP